MSTVFKLRLRQSSLIQSPCLVPVETSVLSDIVICILTFDKLAPDSKLCRIRRYSDAAALKKEVEKMWSLLSTEKSASQWLRTSRERAAGSTKKFYLSQMTRKIRIIWNLLFCLWTFGFWKVETPAESNDWHNSLISFDSHHFFYCCEDSCFSTQNLLHKQEKTNNSDQRLPRL